MQEGAMPINRLVAIGVALSGLVATLANLNAPLAAEDGCAPLLKAFNTKLTEQEIAQNDPRALNAWEEARPHCERGNPAEALQVLNRMLADAGAPPISASFAEDIEAESGG
jgi:hypothetical protein